MDSKNGVNVGGQTLPVDYAATRLEQEVGGGGGGGGGGCEDSCSRGNEEEEEEDREEKSVRGSVY